MCSRLAETARLFGYCRPILHEDLRINIVDGRHPVLDQALVEEKFVPNDVALDGDKNRLLILTGPNMAGKSTYIRQVALLVLLAQTGSWVPAKQAEIGLADRIFTRVGANDDLSRGQSTFMVEMNETANIANNATARSLIILDEIGRGTSTFDGLSIAWSVAEYLHDEVKARTLFATHYHELTELEMTRGGVRNYNVAVREWNDQIIFLRKIVKGGADKSYGIQVARLAGSRPRSSPGPRKSSATSNSTNSTPTASPPSPRLPRRRNSASRATRRKRRGHGDDEATDDAVLTTRQLFPDDFYRRCRNAPHVGGRSPPAHRDLIIGGCEAAILVRWFRAVKPRAFTLMIIANYMSMIAGMVALSWSETLLKNSISIVNIRSALFGLGCGAYLLSVVLELPFVAFAIAREHRTVTRSLAGSFSRMPPVTPCWSSSTGRSAAPRWSPLRISNLRPGSAPLHTLKSIISATLMARSIE